MSAARCGWTQRILNFCQWQKCKRISGGSFRIIQEIAE